MILVNDDKTIFEDVGSVAGFDYLKNGDYPIAESAKPRSLYEKCKRSGQSQLVRCVLDSSTTRLVNVSSGTSDGCGDKRAKRRRRNVHAFHKQTLFYCNGRCRHGERHNVLNTWRCLLCISRKKSKKLGIKNRKKRRNVINNNVMCVLNRSFIIKDCSLIDYRTKVASKPGRSLNEEPKDRSATIGTPRKSKKKRRVGTVENPFSTELSIFRSIQNLIQHFSNLLDEKKTALPKRDGPVLTRGALSPPDNLKAMAKAEGESCDGMKLASLPMARASSKSPQSDEGIEPDPEQKRGFVARCWSLDSAVPSDDDCCQNSHKVRVTRCCSSDSAVLSDDDQSKGKGIESFKRVLDTDVFRDKEELLFLNLCFFVFQTDFLLLCI